MPPRSLLYLALLPLLPVLVFLVLPAQYRESYAYWSSEELNRASGASRALSAGTDGPDGGESVTGHVGGGRVKTWRNMGYWKDTDDYSTAAEALGRELIRFAGAKLGGRVMDIGHGSGESLLLHLDATPPPSHLHALTSLASESRQAAALVSAHLSDKAGAAGRTQVEFHVGSAVPKATDTEHPLHRMRGYMGDTRSGSGQVGGHGYGDGDGTSGGGFVSYDDDDDDEEADNGEMLEDRARTGGIAAPETPKTESTGPTTNAPPYDLIYALDAAYHFPPSRSAFISAAYRHLAPAGVLAYTDILPPPSLRSRPILARFLSIALSVPMDNVVRVHNDSHSHDDESNARLGKEAQARARVEMYKADLKMWGHGDCVEVQDWTNHVWPGFAANLTKRGGVWQWVAKGVRWAEGQGWGVMAVKIAKVGEDGQCPATFRWGGRECFLLNGDGTSSPI